MVCKRAAALTALIAALPLTAFGAILLAEGGVALAFPQNEAAAPPGLRWSMLIVVACCLAASLYLVGSGTYRAARSWGSLFRFAVQSLKTLGVSIVVLLGAVVLGVVGTALGGGIF